MSRGWYHFWYLNFDIRGCGIVVNPFQLLFILFFSSLVSLKHFALKFQLLVLLLRYNFRLNKLQNPPWYVAKYIFHCHIIISFRHCIHRLINETNLKFFSIHLIEIGLILGSVGCLTIPYHWLTWPWTHHGFVDLSFCFLGVFTISFLFWFSLFKKSKNK